MNFLPYLQFFCTRQKFFMTWNIFFQNLHIFLMNSYKFSALSTLSELRNKFLKIVLCGKWESFSYLKISKAGVQQWPKPSADYLDQRWLRYWKSSVNKSSLWFNLGIFHREQRVLEIIVSSDEIFRMTPNLESLISNLGLVKFNFLNKSGRRIWLCSKLLFLDQKLLLDQIKV